MLETRYPLLFANAHSEALLGRTGVEVGPGWLHIVDAFCSLAYADLLAIQGRLDRAVKGGKPPPAIASMQDELTEVKAMLPQILFKEKFGVLRVQMGFPLLALEDDAPGSPPCNARFEAFRLKLDHAASMATAVSARACQMCGRRGAMRDDVMWMVTLCEEHALLLKENPSAFQAAWEDACTKAELL